MSGYSLTAEAPTTAGSVSNLCDKSLADPRAPVHRFHTRKAAAIAEAVTGAVPAPGYAARGTGRSPRLITANPDPGAAAMRGMATVRSPTPTALPMLGSYRGAVRHRSANTSWATSSDRARSRTTTPHTGADTTTYNCSNATSSPLAIRVSNSSPVSDGGPSRAATYRHHRISHRWHLSQSALSPGVRRQQGGGSVCTAWCDQPG